VTKDSAEVIEIGWVVIDAKNPEREVCERARDRRYAEMNNHKGREGPLADLDHCYSSTVNPCWSDP
jgi:hypothetical protein